MSKLVQVVTGLVIAVAVGLVASTAGCGGVTDDMKIDREEIKGVDCITIRDLSGNIDALSCNWEGEGGT